MNRPIYLLIFLLLFIGFFHPVYSITQDLGRHLKTGEIILNTYSVPKTNIFSYTYPNSPFINHHWLSEVIYFTLFQKIGFNGLLIINTALVLLSFLLIFNKVLKKSGTLSLLFCSLLYIPILFVIALAGSFTGKGIVSKIPQKQFRRFVLVAILLIGIKFIYNWII